MLEPQPASQKKNRAWIWIVVILVVVGLCCLLILVGAGAYAAWKGYITLPGLTSPSVNSTPKTPTQIKVEPFQSLSSNNYPALQNLASNWQNPTAPGAQTYAVSVNTNQPVMLAWGWCTTTQPILDQNFQHIQYLVVVDGKSLNLNSLSQQLHLANGQICRDFGGLIRAWPAGKHTIKLTMRLDANINDGMEDFPAGDYVEIYNVTAKP